MSGRVGLAAEDAEERRRALTAIVEAGGADAVAAVVRGLGDEDWRVRKEAVSLVPLVPSRDDLEVSLVACLADTENIGLRNAAVDALASLGPDVLDPVVSALDRLDADGRKLAVEVLARVPDGRSVDRLVIALDDPDKNVVVASAEALGRAGLATEETRGRAAAALLTRLDDTDVALRLAVLDALTHLGAAVDGARLERLSEEPLLRRAAILAAAGASDAASLHWLATALGRRQVEREATLALAARLYDAPAETVGVVRAALLASPASVAALRRAAQSAPGGEWRGAALWLVGVLGDATDLPTLVAALDAEDVAPMAQRGLEVFGPDAAAPLASMLELASPEVRVTLLELLPMLAASLDGSALRFVRDALADTSDEVVAASALALGRFGDERDLGRLVALVDRPEPRVAEAAAAALSALAVRHRSAARALLSALDPTAEHAAAGAAIVTAMARDRGASSPPPEDEIVAFGERALRSVDARARRLAVDALAQSGAPQSAEKIAVALADEEEEVRLAAVRALGAVGAAPALRGLIATSSDDKMVATALRSLAEADLDEAVGIVLARVLSDRAALASVAVEIFARAAGERRREGLLLALRHADKDVVTMALSELAGSLVPADASAVSACLGHAAWEVRRLASELVGELRSEDSRALLRARLEVEREPEVRAVLAEALSLRPPRFDGGGG